MNKTHVIIAALIGLGAGFGIAKLIEMKGSKKSSGSNPDDTKGSAETGKEHTKKA